jgi:hypothetical protein
VSGSQPQTPLSQGPRAQSSSPLHASPGRHVGPQLPPQSASVSRAFFTPSEQEAPEQTPATQMPLWQSVSRLQEPFSGHLGHSTPPQSTSVSNWPITPSMHVPVPVVTQRPVESVYPSKHVMPHVPDLQSKKPLLTAREQAEQVAPEQP